MNNSLLHAAEEQLSKDLDLRRRGIEDALRDMGLNITLAVDCVWKNNTRVYGYMIMDETKNVHPNLYLTKEMLKQSDKELAKIIAGAIPQSCPPTDEIMRWLERDFLLAHSCPRLIADSEINRKGVHIRGLVNIPWEELGLLITFAVVVPFGTEHASIALTDTHLQRAGVAVSELYSVAIENITAKMKFISMGELLENMLGDAFDKDDYDFPMWILTTKDNWQGAALLLSDEAISKISEVTGLEEWLILPSSIHEVIVIPKSVKMAPSDLLKIVSDINDTQVELEEQLTNAVFSYNSNGIRRVAAVL